MPNNNDGINKFTAMDAIKLCANLGESIICPVCLNVFAGRIRQCLIGHSVCDECYGKLAECPTCRGHLADYIRNYQLEELISRLHQSGLTSTLTTAETENDCTTAALAITGQRSSPAPVQGRGLFTCRASIDCTIRLPICRLYNHLRQLHGETFVTSTANLLRPAGASPVDHRYHARMTVSLRRSMRRAVHIRKSGVFFICFDAINSAPAVKKSPNRGGNDAEVIDDAEDAPTHMAWVQTACSNGEARAFRFRCELVYGGKPQTQATFEDAVFGEPWRSTDVLAHRYALCVRVPAKLAKATLRVSISANEELRDTRRRKHTQLRTLSGASTGAVSAAQTTAT